jgi:hypothetical protein
VRERVLARQPRHAQRQVLHHAGSGLPVHQVAVRQRVLRACVCVCVCVCGGGGGGGAPRGGGGGWGGGGGAQRGQAASGGRAAHVPAACAPLTPAHACLDASPAPRQQARPRSPTRACSSGVTA